MKERKVLFCIILFTFIHFFAFAQNGTKEEIEKVKEKVVYFFNSKQADSIYELTGEDFRKTLSRDNFRALLEDQLFPLGAIKATELEKYKSCISKYKTTFDAVKLNFILGLDAKGKLYTLLFQPYKEKSSGLLIRTATDNPLASVLDKKADTIIQQFMLDSKTVGMSIGLMKNGKFYFYNYGETKKGNKTLPTSDNLYEIGSITKTFTGLLLANAVIDGKIKLNDPVNKYLPDTIPDLKLGNDVVKVVHLSNHTSGLPRMPINFWPKNALNPYIDYSISDLFSFLKVVRLLSPPGEKSSYSNLGVGMLGIILERIYKRPYEELMHQFITNKTGMMNTVIELSKANEKLFMQGYNENINETSRWDFDAVAGAGAIRSNIKDMLIYAKINVGMNVANLQLKNALDLAHKTTFDNGQQKLALGWFKQNWDTGEVLFHGGQTGGYKSFIAINPATKNAVVLLSNTAVSNDEPGVKLMQMLDRN